MTGGTFRDVEKAIEDADVDDLAEIIGQLGRLEAIAWLRLRHHERDAAPTPDIEPTEKLVDVHAAAEILGVEPRWLYERSNRLPFARKLGERTLRFSEPGIQRWLETRP